MNDEQHSRMILLSPDEKKLFKEFTLGDDLEIWQILDLEPVSKLLFEQARILESIKKKKCGCQFCKSFSESLKRYDGE